MSVLLVDIGNTRIKWCLEGGTEARSSGALDKDGLTQQVWPDDIQRVLVASVQENQEIKAYFEEHFASRLVWLGHTLDKPELLVHCYPKPERLGVDRWLAMLGVRQYFPCAGSQAQGAIVVDAGTALTVDVISPESQHLGGHIVPGLAMAQEALFAKTDKVNPFQDEERSTSTLLGQDTLNAVASGVLRQQQALVESVCRQFPDFELLITGGDGNQLATALEVRYYSDLVFDGMKRLSESLCD